MSYSPERRVEVLSKMLTLDQRSILDLTKVEGIVEPTLNAKRTKDRSECRLMPDLKITSEGRTSHDWFASVMEAATICQAEDAEYCSSKGIHTSQVAVGQETDMNANNWEQENNAQLKSATQVVEKRTKILKLRLLRNGKVLAEAAASLILRGKLHARFGGGMDE